MKSFDFPNMIKTNSAAILQDKKATENNFKLLLMSEKGELFGDPYYGVSTKLFIYDQNSPKLKDIFIDEILRPYGVYKGLIAKVEDLLDGSLSEKDLKQRYHFNNPNLCLKSAYGVEFFVSTQWSLQTIEKLINQVVNKFGMSWKKQNS